MKYLFFQAKANKMKYLFLILSYCLSLISFGQEHHEHQESETEAARHAHKAHPSSFLSLNLPMSVNASGTAWHPENSPMFMNLFQPGEANIMVHYGLFAGYTFQKAFRKNNQRGSNEIFTPTWVMVMAQKQLGEKNLIFIRTMISADPLTMGGNGYPLLLQTGETFEDEPLIDRQHPHDLISELAAGVSHAFNEKTDLYAYFGFPGEPAIGPPAFMHRPSALINPFSPLGHHWQDATHILFGVGTAGFRYDKLKLEGSWFTGREPDEDRYAFDQPRFDSWSVRASALPSECLALQASFGFLKSPEVHEPENDVYRSSFSALHNYHFNRQRILSSTFVWGLNTSFPATDRNETSNSHSFLLESTLYGDRVNFFTRLELVQKSFHELEIHDVPDESENQVISGISFGYSFYLLKNCYFFADLGSMATVNIIPSDLHPYYGSLPLSVQVYLRLQPPLMRM